MDHEIEINLRNILGRTPREVESFVPGLLSLIGTTRLPIVLDLRAVQWICPYGAILLLEASSLFAQRTGRAVRLTGMGATLHAYLRRIDFFLAAAGSAFTDDPFDGEDLSRSSASTRVLELTRVGCEGDVFEVKEHARRILEYWLPTSSNIGAVVGLISEACSNVVQHSDTTGWIVIQKYDRSTQGVVDVELAIGDLGKGIPTSLRQVDGEVAESASGYIRQALRGLTARGAEATGQGLQAMRDTTVGSGGHIFVRSDRGWLSVGGGGLAADDDGLALPGTHLALRFRVRI